MYEGRWNFEETKHSINYLELLAIKYAIQSLYEKERRVHIEIQSDNISVIKYINDMGGIASEPMDLLATDIWEWCLLRQIHISAVYVPGCQNTADFYSRNFSDSTEWQLKTDVFKRLCDHFFVPDIDLFSSRLNKQLDVFVSWFPEPGALHCDAFSFSWHNYRPYIFPPFSLVGKVINKIIEDKVEKAILVFPLWKSQSWFPLLLDNLCSFPVRLPRHKDLLVLPHNRRCHPLCKTMRIVAAIVSGRRSITEDFRKQLQISSLALGGLGPGSSTDQLGRNGLFGIVSGLEIHFRPLRW